jgi:hypothetical protein
MSNLKISQLPSYTGNTSGSWLVMNNSGETTTYKVQRENLLSGYQPSGNYATTGSNTFNGDQIISGSVNIFNPGTTALRVLGGQFSVSGSVTINGSTPTANKPLYFTDNSGSVGMQMYYNPFTRGFVMAQLGSGGMVIATNETLNLQCNTRTEGNMTITGSLQASGSLHTLIGAVTVSGSAAGVGNGLNVIGNTLLSGSVIINGSSDSTTKFLFFSNASGSAGGYLTYNPSANSGTGQVALYASGSGETVVGLVTGRNTIGGDTRHTGSLTVTGSVNISSVMTLAKQNPLPTGTTGSLAVSGSGLYFHNGTSWNLIS